MPEEETGGFSFQDKRRIDPETGKPRGAADPSPAAQGQDPNADEPRAGAAEAPAGDSAGGPADPAPQAEEGAGPEGDTVPDDASGIEDLPPAPEESAPADPEDPNAVLAEERLNDLKRINAEYASYRARAAREQEAAKSQGVFSVVEALIPVLDELKLAKDNGDVAGPFETHAQKLLEALGRVGVEQYGEPGEEFDPAVHEALMQQPSSDVDTTTIFVVMQPGYRLGDRVVRAARVGVFAPEDE